MGPMPDPVDAPTIDPAASESALLRSILDTVPDAMIVIDEQGGIQFFSSAAARLFGYTVEEVAERLEVSVSTVEGDWRLARAWLRQRLGGSV